MSDTPEELSPVKRELLRRLRRTGAIAPPGAGAVTARGPRSRLARAQERIWLQERLYPGTAQHNLAAAYRIRGPLQAAVLCDAMASILDRHEVLRSAFLDIDGEVWQEPRRLDLFQPDRVSLRAIPAADRELRLKERLFECANAPFDLAAPPLCRATVFDVAEDDAVLLIVVHHIAADGWSLGIFLRELSAFYAAASRAERQPPEPVTLRFRDYAERQREEDDSEDVRRSIAHFMEVLSGELPVLDLPSDRPRRDVPDLRAGTWRFEIDPQLRQQVDTAAAAHNTTPFVVMLAAYQLLLARFSGQGEVITGIVDAGRWSPELEPLIGCVINTLPVRTTLSRHDTFGDLVRRLTTQVRAAVANRQAPFQSVVRQRSVPRIPGHAPLFQSMFVFQNSPIPPLELAGARTSPIDVDAAATQLDLTLVIDIDERSYRAKAEFSASVLDARFVALMCRSYCELLGGAVRNTAESIWRLPLLSPSDRREATEADQGASVELAWLRVDVRIADIARRTPESVALRQGSSSLTYTQVIERAHAVAAALRQLPGRPPARVGVLLDRTLDLPVALLGVLAAGAAYVPMDPEHPAEWMRSMLEDARVDAVLTEARLSPLARTIAPGVARLSVEDVDAGGTGPSALPIDPDAAAYVIYTSGSSGRPKGVEVTHRSLANLLQAVADNPGFSSGDVLLALAPLTFDMSPLEIFVPLTCGGRVEMAPAGLATRPEQLGDLLEHSGATHFQATPSVFRNLLAAGWCGNRRLKVWIGGEGLPPKLAGALCERVGELHNLYGPTECTVWATGGRITDPARIHVGRPLANMRVYVLDEAGEPVPTGAKGEIVIGGAGVARGYVTESARRENRFVVDPFAPSEGRMYRTGDLGRRRGDGMLEVLGRSDNQVKIRGFRVELGEVEAILAQHPAVENAVAVAQEDAGHDRRLLAYVTWRGTPDARTEAARLAELREYVADKLPHYMVPSLVVPLQAFPLTRHGKVDRAALPPPDVSVQLTHTYVAPRSEMERMLCRIWAETLGIERVGIDDSFFAIGGHSIAATRVAARVRERVGLHLPLQQLVQRPTIRRLAEFLAGARADQPPDGLPSIVPDAATRHEPFPMTEVQQAYFVGRSDAFRLGNTAAHSYTEIACGELDLDRLGRALRQLIRRHDTLRAVFSTDGTQRILKTVPAYDVHVVDLRHVDAGRMQRTLDAIRGEMAHRVYAPDRWPLFDLRITRAPGGDRLHVSVDLLLVDLVSAQHLLRELAVLYADPEADLPRPAISFRDYVMGLQRLRGSPLHARSREYWLARIPTLPPPPELPTIRDAADIKAPVFRRRRMTIPGPSRSRLTARATALGVTPSVLLLTAFSAVLARWSRQPRFTINLTLFNRLPMHADVPLLTGDFTSLTLLEVDAGAGATFGALARALQRRLWEDLEHRHFGGVDVLREMNSQRGRQQAVAMPIVFTSALGVGSPESADTASVGSPAPPALGSVDYGITQTPQTWLDHQVYEEDGRIALVWDAVEEMFPTRLLDDMFGAYESLLDRLAGHEADQPLRHLIDLPQHQRRQREALACTRVERGAQFLDVLVTRRAAETPDQTAVVGPGYRLSYGELHAHAAAVSAALETRRPDAMPLVAVAMEKGWEQIAAALGVLASGAAYVPIDPHLPADRLRHVLERAGARVVITQPRLRDEVPWPRGVETLMVQRGEVGPARAEPVGGRAPNDLAYVIFTSGSTGLPKGVMIEHGAAVNTVLDINARYSVTNRDRVLGISALTFDLSVYDVFGLLAAGGTVVMPDPERARDCAHWLQLVTEHGVTIWNSVPALAELLVEELERQDGRTDSLRLVLMSGDWIPVRLPDRARRVAPRARMVSLGGATEASIWSVAFDIDAVDPSWRSIPYGTALTNQTVDVLAPDGSPAPDWVAGEIYIGGSGLARGYWRDDEATAAAFGAHAVTGARVYRTGDWGRVLPTGTIEFLGRDDHQVKVRGHRIELGEIEAVLQQHPGISQAVVVASGDGLDRKLIAYVVPAPSGRPAAIDLAPRSLPDLVSCAGVTGSTPIVDPAERTLFVLAQHGLRVFGPGVRDTPLAVDPGDRRAIPIGVRQPHWNAIPGAPPLDGAPLARFGRWMACLRQVAIDGAPVPKRYYPSAGSAYPVQVYVHVHEDAIEGLPGGYHYYDPAGHRLVAVTPAESNGMAPPGFDVYLVAQLAAIEPLYGPLSERFCLIEAGHMAQLMAACGRALGVGVEACADHDESGLPARLRLAHTHQVLFSLRGACHA